RANSLGVSALWRGGSRCSIVCRVTAPESHRMSERFGVQLRVDAGLGVLHELTGAIARRQGDVALVEILGKHDGELRIYFEIEIPENPDALVDELRALPIVREVNKVATLQVIYG